MAQYKTIQLAGSEQEIKISGQNCDIRNDGVDVVYASAKSGIVEGADGVLSIPAGHAAKLLDSCGTAYVLGTGTVVLCGNDYAYLVFKTAATSSGEGGIDEDARRAINDHAGNTDIHLDALGAVQAAATAISNPNLLIDPDFRINQRGLESYSDATQYTVDRWYAGSGITVIPSDSGIIVRCDIESNRLFLQKLELTDEVVGVPMTFSTKIEEIHGSSIGIRIGTFENQYQYLNGKLNDTGIFSFTFTPASKYIMIQPCTPGMLGDYVKLNWVKLEIGSVATPFIPPDPATELVKCQRYYQVSTTGDIAPVDLRPSMRIAPTVTQLDDGNYAYDAEL